MTDSPFLTPQTHTSELERPYPSYAYGATNFAPSAISVGPSVETPQSTPRGSTAYNAYPDRDGTSTPNLNNNAPLLVGGERDPSAGLYDPYTANKEQEAYDAAERASRPFYRKPWFWMLAAAVVAAVVVAVVVPVVLVAHKNGKSGGSASEDSSSGGGSGSGGGGGGAGGGKGGNLATSGGDGSTVTMDDGTTFVYHNSFGGFWVSDPANPFNNSAKANSWTPALDEEWTWGSDHISGVNLGGLFVLEPFITPSLFQAYPGSVDEWTLSTQIALANANGSNSQNLTQVMENHYSTFITEQDIAQIAGAGLSWIRMPIPFWAIETWADVGQDTPGGPAVAEPFLAKVCWTYILKVLQWARKYGLRVELDLHTVPGSQNGYNHSGKLGQINWLNGVMGVANAERTLDYIRAITEFISQPEYVDLIPMFGIVNEALLTTIGKDQLSSFYLQAYNTIRGITGIGQGNGPYMVIHDGFTGLAQWANFMPGSDRIALDTHPYFAFDGAANSAPIAAPATGGDGTMLGGPWPLQACNAWGPDQNNSRSNFGVTIAGEFSNGFNDCGLYVRGVGTPPMYSGDCTPFMNSGDWNDTMKGGIMNFALASMDTLEDWFFWTWKIGNDSVTGTVQAPLWSYQLGLENGWIPTDPRKAAGVCASLSGQTAPFVGTFSAWQTGGSGAGTIAPTATTDFAQFPPTTIAGVPAGQVPLLPTYTQTKAPVTLPPPTFTASVTASIGNGWVDASDTAQMNTAVAGCTYPDAWNAIASPVPTAACGSGGVATVPTAVTPAALPPASSSVSAALPPASIPATSVALTSDPAAVPTVSNIVAVPPIVR
ncbi:hypothetical protein PHLCEN_2v3730 [Hermanssonia centrifuga]|uniref:glucan 1,3-beta-glucosidase n=1 Tax=Hermanssonia centrifuga TaxID=98765 RepID=A0A2R6QBQ4_9APHY|nr:hypothetical protein PHLCEN_2v3730 [Hermanssonia centrifuga]